MAKPDPRTVRDEFIAKVLRGERITADDVDDLRRRRVPEDSRLDYKAGSITRSDNHPSAPGDPTTFDGKLRKHVCAFANAEGGILVLGVGEPATRPNPTTGVEEPDPTRMRPIVPFVGFGSDRLKEVAGRALNRLRPSLSVPVVIEAVDHPEGLLLVVGVPRSESLVYTVEHEQIVHYLRIHDSTVHAPGYLVQDIVLGRRQRPVVEARVDHTPVTIDGATHLVLSLTNVSMVWLEHVRVGLVGYGKGNIRAVPETVAGAIDVRPAPTGRLGLFAMEIGWVDHHQDVRFVGPFESFHASLRNLRVSNMGPITTWAGALYVASLNQPPLWFQLGASLMSGNSVTAALMPTGSRRPIAGMVAGSPPADWYRWTADGQLEPPENA
jgi:hypothetical protein